MQRAICPAPIGLSGSICIGETLALICVETVTTGSRLSPTDLSGKRRSPTLDNSSRMGASKLGA